MKGLIALWSGQRPTGGELEERIRRELRIVRPEGYRSVADPWGDRVTVELARIRDYIGRHRQDASRWRLIPAIVPTIKQATHLCAKGQGITYEADLAIARAGGPYRRTFFVQGKRVPGERAVFASTHAGDIRRKRKGAGSRQQPRPNPVERANMGTRDPGSQDRAARRLPGAAPALRAHDTL